MTTNTAKNQGPAAKPVIRGALIRRAAALVLLAAAAPAVWADTVLEKIGYNALPGGRVELTLTLSGPPPEPQVFTTDTPPRIAMDLADTRSGLSDKHIEVNTGATTSVSAVEAAGRTRVVVDLVRPSSYETRVDGNNLVVTIANGVTGSSTTTAMVGNDPTKSVAAGGTEIANVTSAAARTAKAASCSPSPTKAPPPTCAAKATR